MGYTRAIDFQGVNQWIYGRMFDDPDGDYYGWFNFSALNPSRVGDELRWTNAPGAEGFRVFAYDGDPASGGTQVAYVDLPGGPVTTTGANSGNSGSLVPASGSTLRYFVGYDIVTGQLRFYPTGAANVNNMDFVQGTFDSIVDELTDPGVYHFRIQAISSLNPRPVAGLPGVHWGQDSQRFTATGAPFVVPEAAPDKFLNRGTAAVGGFPLGLSWTAVPGAYRYTVYAFDDESEDNPLLAARYVDDIDALSLDVRTYLNRDPNPYTAFSAPYWFRVRAYDSNGLAVNDISEPMGPWSYWSETSPHDRADLNWEQRLAMYNQTGANANIPFVMIDIRNWTTERSQGHVAGSLWAPWHNWTDAVTAAHAALNPPIAQATPATFQEHVFTAVAVALDNLTPQERLWLDGQPGDNYIRVFLY
ncbi:MAG: hypothetical protein FWE20_00585 [Defluviitaleaceae bacterium]|nr:hypothetical protein [Defluviitaleaceae bacterium]